MLSTLHCEKPDVVVCGYRCFELPDFICRTLPYSLYILPKINKWLEIPPVSFTSHCLASVPTVCSFWNTFSPVCFLSIVSSSKPFLRPFTILQRPYAADEVWQEAGLSGRLHKGQEPKDRSPLAIATRSEAEDRRSYCTGKSRGQNQNK